MKNMAEICDGLLFSSREKGEEVAKSLKHAVYPAAPPYPAAPLCSNLASLKNSLSWPVISFGCLKTSCSPVFLPAESVCNLASITEPKLPCPINFPGPISSHRNVGKFSTPSARFSDTFLRGTLKLKLRAAMLLRLKWDKSYMATARGDLASGAW